MKSLLLANCISVLITFSTYAQQDSSQTNHESFLRTDESVFTNDVKTVFQTAGTIFTAPFHFEKKEWIETGVIVAGTALLFTVDNSARPLVQHNQSQFGDNVFAVGRQYGRELYGLSLSGGLYLGGLAFRNHDVRETGMMLFESIVFAGVTTNIIKVLAGRSRPYMNEGTVKFHGFEFDNDFESLPSGHTTVAFAVSSVLSSQINNTWASVGLYSFATLTAFSRVYHDEHWISDTFLGAVIGNVVGKTVVNLHKREDKQTSLLITPSVNGLRVEMIY